nr:phosphohistidine phosphatase SixA [Pseudomonas sp. WS 5013]
MLRHGEAEARARSDAERPLTERGRKEVRRCAERLRGRPLQYILASPYLRAQQTAEIVREVLGLALPLTTVDWATPDDSPREAANRLDSYPGHCLLVSHNPLLGQLAGFLQHGHLQEPLLLRTASLVELDGAAAIPGLMQLAGLYHPE